MYQIRSLCWCSEVLHRSHADIQGNCFLRTLVNHMLVYGLMIVKECQFKISTWRVSHSLLAFVFQGLRGFIIPGLQASIRRSSGHYYQKPPGTLSFFFGIYKVVKTCACLGSLKSELIEISVLNASTWCSQKTYEMFIGWCVAR